MPARYPMPRRNSDNSDSHSYYSDGSDYSDSTAPTIYSGRPSVRQHSTDPGQYILEKESRYDSYFPSSDGRESVCTYASTTPSDADFDEEEEEERAEYVLYQEPAELGPVYEPAAVPSSPQEFAEYFPSTRRLCIRHDDSVDGNMNLRVDTEATRSEGRRVDLTLFHLRMHDLKNRQFSLRRYCRDSGREVCNSTRKCTKPATARRPGLQRSMSNALASLRSKSESKVSKASLKRTDSGYDSMSEGDDEDSQGRRLTDSSNLQIPTNTINLEFSNYAHIDLNRRGSKSSKRYEFEYWGTPYAWKKAVTKKDNGGDSQEISYHLYNRQTLKAVAHIVPVPMTPDEAREEEMKGGWVPPCSMWISDASVLSGDVAE
jgi:hypothetical protein